MPKKAFGLTFMDVRERIVGDVEPTEQGAKDGVENFPGDGAAAATPYRLEIWRRARDIAGDLEKSASEAVKREIDALRHNPFDVPGASAAERCGAAQADALGAMDARLHDDHHKLVEAKDHRSLKQRNRDHDFHLADARSPPRGWANRWKSLNSVTIVAATEIGISYGVLHNALGPVKAVMWGAIGPTVTMLLGGLAGYLDLRPASRRERRSARAVLRRIGAVLSAGAAATVMYAISAYRSVLIDGMDGLGAEIWQRAAHEAYKMAQPETLVLAILGALGFVVAHRKVRDYFGGFTPRIREVDLARIDAQNALVRGRDTMIAYVTEPAQRAMANLAGQLSAVRAWSATIADAIDRILGHILDHNEGLRIINDALDSVDQDYRRSNAIVRTAPAPDWAGLPIAGQELAIPEVVTQARERSVEITKAWTLATDKAFAELNRAIRDAIAFIDEVAGLSTISETAPRQPTLAWRQA